MSVTVRTSKYLPMLLAMPELQLQALNVHICDHVHPAYVVTLKCACCSLPWHINHRCARQQRLSDAHGGERVQYPLQPIWHSQWPAERQDDPLRCNSTACQVCTETP